jgi:hypothetical protein
MLRLRRLAPLLLPLLFPFPAVLHAQTADDANEGLRLSPAPEGNALQLSWFGRTGRIYFIEHSTDLFVWQALPAFEVGADAIASYGLPPPAPDTGLFVRLRSLSATLTQFQGQDTDKDGLLNAAEASAGLNPFTRDTDKDGLPDGYETAFDLDPLSVTGLADRDDDEVPNQEDARPADPAIGRLSVSILSPLDGGAL